MAPKTLENVLKSLPKGIKDDNLIVGYESKDDAAVYKINDEVSIIETLDFFPSMVEDPYLFGQIAATNSLSDVWAMGGKPVMALNIAAFPEGMNPDTIEKVLKGGAEKVIEAGCTLCGGHTIVDETVKYGLSVTGIVDTKKVLTNNGVKLGDKIILTKPLGVGILLTAHQCEVDTKEDFDAVVKSMTTLNKYAAEILFKYKVSALTDVTGFGLFNHLNEMLDGKQSAKLYIDKIPIVNANVKKYVEDDYYTGGAIRNEDAIKDKIDFGNTPEWIKQVGYDPQTSGGLLCSISSEDADKAMSELAKLEIRSEIIGEVIEKSNKAIYLA
jgi:selenide,water dikinase